MGDIQVRAVEPQDWPDIAELFDQPAVIAGTLQLPFEPATPAASAWRRRRRLACCGWARWSKVS